MKKLKQFLAWMLVLCMVCSYLPVSVFAAENAPTTKLDTTDSPFQQGTGESNSFRIPALVTLSDGTLVAAADARWNTTFDGGGLDTMVAISRDKGATWTHSFANYLGDNGNIYNGSSSTAFIDPALAVYRANGSQTVYMLCDLYPYGVALNGNGSQTAPSNEVGFTDEGYLKLDYNSQGTYGYYLKDGGIWANGGTAPLDGYTVDDHFNITNAHNNTTTNLFFSDSLFKVVRTGYLYLTKSTDGGQSWSAPQLLNLKTDQELVCLVGPGRGLVTANGNIVFPVYSYDGSETSQRLGFVYSSDGVNWSRSENLDYAWASESVAIELNDGNLRFFFRNGSKALTYVDYNWTSGWGEPQTTGQAVNSNCQISAIRLEQTIGGERVVLVSCPGGSDTNGSNQSGAEYRTNGKIFLFTLGQDNSMTLQATLSVPSVNSGNSFMYSCMTALTDENGNETGDIAILYEDNQSAWGAGDNCYYQMSYKTYDVEEAFGVTFGDAEEEPDVPGGDEGEDEDSDAIAVNLKVGQTQTFTDATGNYENFEGNVAPKAEIATMTVSALTQAGNASYTVASELESGAQYLITKGTSIITSSTSTNGYQESWGGAKGLLMTTGTIAYGNNLEQHLWTITLVDGGYTVMNAAGQYLNIAAADNDVTLSATPVVLSIIDNGDTFTLHNNNYCLNNFGGSNQLASSWSGTTDTNAAWTLHKFNPATAGSTSITFEGKKVGETTATVGNTQYNITVTTDKVEEIELEVGASTTITDSTGNYENNIVKEPDAAIATMEVTGMTVPGSSTVTEVATVVNGNSYYVRTNNNTYLTASAEETDDPAKAAKWHFDDIDACTLTCGSKYLSYANGSFTAVDSEWNAVYFYINGGTLRIYDGGYVNVGTAVDISVVNPSESTSITFQGQKAGTTTAIVGNTQYNITVLPKITKTVDITVNAGDTTVYVDDSGEFTDITVVPNAGIATVKILNQLIPVTEIESSKQYLIVNRATGDILTDNAIQVPGKWDNKPGLETTGKASADSDMLWTITKINDQYTIVRNGKCLAVAGYEAHLYETEVPLSLTHTDDGWIICDEATGNRLGHGAEPNYLSDNVGDNYTAGALGTALTTNEYIYWDIYEVHPDSTVVEFTGISEGTTEAVIGTTRYNITVSQKHSEVVDIELEIGENFTFTDTTGNHSGSVIQTPDGTYATMQVSGTVNSTEKDVEEITERTFEVGNRYILENVRAKGNQADHSILTPAEDYGGLVMNGPLNAATSQVWSIIPDNYGYLLMSNGEYVTIGNETASMETYTTMLTFEFVQDKGWLISYDGYYLSDLRGNQAGEAYGYNNRNDDGNYWNIYKEVDKVTSEATLVTFSGVAEGTATAIVGNTQYNITVVAPETDDEVMHSATGTWTVDPEIQHRDYNSLIGLYKDLYTDDSWTAYETARQAAYRKLIEVTNARYDSRDKADAALGELTALVAALETARGNLDSAKTFSICYRLDTLDGTIIDTREYKLAAGETVLILPDTIVVNNIAYAVTNTTVDLSSSDTTFHVPVTLIGKLGAGFVAGEDAVASSSQIADLVDNNGVAKKITEMTVTVGISYKLDTATDAPDERIVWTSENEEVATIGADGTVTAVGEGTTNITATIKDANGNILEVNTIPITVFPKGSGDRKTAMYIDHANGTTVWCVINADTENRAFQVIEGELIFGQFDTTVADGTKTTAISFFADPDEAHALVYMRSTGSAGDYYQLHDKDGNLYDGTVSGNSSSNYYISGTTGGAGYWQAMGLNENNSPDWTPIKKMVQWAIDQNCDGGLGFTRRQNEGSTASLLSFGSDPLPNIQKTVDGVLPTTRKQANYRPYVENMVAAVQEQVYFKITVTLEVPGEWRPKVVNGNIQKDENDNIIYEEDENGNRYSAILYSEVLLTDDILPGAFLYTKELDMADGFWDGNILEKDYTQTVDIGNDLNAAWTPEELAAGQRVLDYYLVYEIREEDIPRFWIDNVAHLNYDYASTYSSGAQAGAADAEAHITVVGTDIDDVVMDFGQKIVYSGLTNAQLKGVFVDGDNDDGITTQCKTSAKYGEVHVTRTPQLDANGKPLTDDQNYPLYDYTVTYTPHSILQETDAVVLYGIGESGKEKVINGFLVYPATTVYYEEGFMMNDASTWDRTAAKKASGEQTLELLGKSRYDQQGAFLGKFTDKKYDTYGYDPLYEQEAYDYGDSYASADAIGQTTTFTITGTGFDLYANCTMASGYISVIVKNSAGQFVKMYMVDTVVKEGDTPATADQKDDEFHLPVVSADLGVHDTYTITVNKILDRKTVKLDGIRVYNTLEDSSVFNIDLEDNPEFYQLRDYVLAAVDVDKTASAHYGPDWMEQDSLKIGPLAEQVYGTISTDSERPYAVVTSVEPIYGDGATAQDLLDNGPKNELFLYPGQTLTFNVTTNRVIQIGLKAPRTPTSYTLKYEIGQITTTVADKKALKTSVDMFYALGDAAQTPSLYEVSVTNNGDDILSVTDLKICDDPQAALVPLTVENIEHLLRDAGLGDAGDGGDTPPTEPSEPTEPETEPSEPETEPTESETEPTEPETEPSKPETEPAESETEPAESETEPAEPETEPSKPATEPTESETEPSKPETEPSEPETEPTESETEPAVVLITRQPADYQGSVGDTVSFTVAAEGDGLTYQWYYRSGDSSWQKSSATGFNTATLQITLLAYRDGYQYRCVITDRFGSSVTSEAASMTVRSSEITITSQPADVTDGAREQLYTFQVAATGENLTYRWEYSDDGGETWQLTWNEGYNTDTLSVRLYAHRDGNLYRCQVTSGMNTAVYSNPATLNLQAPSVSIVKQPASVSAVAGTVITIKVDAIGTDLTYCWYRSNDKGATWTQTYLSGWSTDTLSFSANSSREAMYMCRITDGSGKIIWTDTATLKILSSDLKILAQPTDVTCAAGATATFTVEAQGDTLKYRWYACSDGGETWTLSYLTGYNTAEYAFVVNATRAAKVYKCVITDAAGNTAETNAVSVTIG